MPTIKLIVSDLDDTLLNKDLQITTENKRAINRLKDKGIYFTIATGRMFRSALPYAQELGIDLPLVTYQGALIKRLDSQVAISHRPVPLEIARELIKETEELGFHLNAYVNDELLVKELTPEGSYYQDIARVPMKVIGSMTANLPNEPTKLLVINREEELIPLLKKWEKRYKQELYLTRSKPNFLEIMAKGADKGNGIKLLAESLGITPEEIMVIGDSYNDLEMFDYSGLSVAMGNAREEIQKRADYVTSTHEESGVARAIEKFALS